MAKKKKKKSRGGAAQQAERAAAAGAPAAGRTPKPRDSRKHSAPRKRRSANWPVLVLALAGMVLTTYMVQSYLSGAELAFCEDGAGCDIVQNSMWGRFMNIPTSFLGFTLYLLLAVIAYQVRNPEWHWKSLYTLSLIGVAYSVYLTVVSQTVIGATCIYCIISLGLLLAIFAVVVYQYPGGFPGFSWPAWAGQTLVLAAVIVGGMHFYYSTLQGAVTGPEDPYVKGLAMHLKDSGVVFYGAYW